MKIVGQNKNHQHKKELSLSLKLKDLEIHNNIENITNIICKFYSCGEFINVVTNEMLTNCIKYSKKNSDITINTFADNQNKICIIVENECTKKQVDILNKYINMIKKKSDPISLYVDRINYLLKNENESAQIGLLSIMGMYGCDVDIKIYDLDRHNIVSTTVTT